MAKAKKPTAKKTTAKSGPKPDDMLAVQDAIVVDEIPLSKQPVTEDPPPVTGRGGLIPLIAGGLIAGGIGFATATFLNVSPQPVPVDTSATDRREAAMTERLTALDNRVADLSNAVTDHPNNAVIIGVESRLDGVEKLVTAQSEALELLLGRLTELERRPAGQSDGTAGATDNFNAELADFRKQMTTEIARLQSALEEEPEPVGPSPISIAISAIEQAMNNGDAFAGALSDLTDRGVDVPDDLETIADVGVVTLVELQAQFPVAARASLTAATRAQTDGSAASKLGAFLRIQLGARSLEPRAGDDPDAILSRAEAALNAGDISGAIAEIQSLPPAGLAQMAQWVELATGRQNAVNAVAALSALSKI